MATKAQAIKEIAALGGSVDWEVSQITSSEKVITVDAPEGYAWQFNGCECICLAWYTGSAADFWEEIIDAVQYGVESL